MTDADSLASLVRSLLPDDGPSPTVAEPLFTSGRLDSIALQEIVTWIEDRHDIVIDIDAVSVANFDSIERITTFVDSVVRCTDRP